MAVEWAQAEVVNGCLMGIGGGEEGRFSAFVNCALNPRPEGEREEGRFSALAHFALNPRRRGSGTREDLAHLCFCAKSEAGGGA